MVEIHYHLGLEEEAKKYANILGYNYNSSEWYQQSYKIFNNNYKPVVMEKKALKDKKKNLFEKIVDIIK